MSRRAASSSESSSPDPKEGGHQWGHRVVKEPLYLQVAGVIRSDLLPELKPGDRLTPEVKLAEQFGVSVITIRQALSELVKGGLLERRRGSGTYLASAKPPGRHVGILLDVDIGSGDVAAYFRKLVQELRDALMSVGLASRVYLGRRPLGEEPGDTISCQDLLDDLALDRLRGVIGFLVKSKDHAWSQAFWERGIPTLDSADIGNPQLTARRMMQAAMAHFKQRGRRRIALIGWRNPWIREAPFPAVFYEAAAEVGIPVDSRLVDFAAEGWVQGMGWERLRDIWLSGPKKPDGLLILDDMLYRDCEKAIESLGVKVPTQLDIVVRSSDAAALVPQFPIVEMKTFVQPTAEMYANAMKLLIEGHSIPKAEMHWAFEEVGDAEPRLLRKAKAPRLAR